MNPGVNRVIPDSRDRSWHRTFGATTPSTFPDSWNTDANLTCPNQNAEGLPNGCTGFSQSELCTDEDKCIYKPQFTYLKTQQMEGTAGQNVGCDIRDSLNSTIVYGVQVSGETDEQAFTHRRGSYYQIEQAPDYFDGIRSALIKNRSVSIATPWYGSFSFPDVNGIVTAPASWSTSGLSYHNYKICGYKTIAGTVYLTAKPWLGPQYGINGYSYFSREIINQLLDQTFTGAFVLDVFDPNSKTVALYTTYEVLIGYLQRILTLLRGN